MTDETFERDIRTMLAARDPGHAPDRLAVAVEGRIADAGRRSRVAVWPRLLSGGRLLSE